MPSSLSVKLTLILIVLVLAVGDTIPAFSAHSQAARVVAYGNDSIPDETSGTPTQDRLSTHSNTLPIEEGLLTRPHYTPLPNRSTGVKPQSSTPPPANYDEQLGTTFTQSFDSIAYNVTAIGQSDTNGYGPAYLLNGLTSAGYWYQVGVAYDWPFAMGGYSPGFNLVYEVFDSNQRVVLPSGGGGGLSAFSGPVNSGDPVQLSLNFSSGNVVMQGEDVKTGASASVSYSDQGASSFMGSPFSIANSNGFFTGLMTEWYHANPYFGDEGRVDYSDPHFALSSAWMWIDEFDVANLSWSGAFSDHTSSPVTYSSNSDQFQSFASHGASESSNANEFVTGPIGCVASTALSSSTLACNGLGPTTISLLWSQSGYLLFSKYLVQQSTTGSNGPWASIDTITSKSNTTDYIRGLSPNATYWWRIEDVDCCGATATTNILQVKQPNNATLSYTPLSDTAYQFTWNNTANYTGLIAFDSYQLEESVNGGSYSVVYASSSVSASSSIQTLSPDIRYSFYVVTTDKCATCSGSGASSSNSSSVTFGTPLMLAVSVTVQPNSVDVGQPLSFNCNGAGGVPPYSYTWTFGDGQTGTGQRVTHSYASSGVMSVVCTLSDSLHSSVLGITSTSILPDPYVTTPSANPHSIDAGQTVQFAALANGGSGGYTYAWLNLPTGCDSSDTSSLYCRPTTTGSFLVSVNVTDSNMFSVLSTQLPFVIYPDPSIVAVTALPSKLDLGQPANLAISAVGGYGSLSYSYSGLPPGCTTADIAILACTPSGTGTYSVTGTAVDANGFSVVSKPFSIVVNPDPTITVVASPSELDVNQKITLSISASRGTGVFSYTYQNLPFGCQPLNSPTLSCTPPTSGNFTIQITVTDETGGTATSSVNITVNPDPIIVSFRSSSSVIASQQATFTVSVTGGTRPLAYSYSALPPGCSSTNSAILPCTPSTSGSYIVQVTVTDHAGKTATSFLSINVSQNTIFGLSPLEAYSTIAAIIVAVIATSVVAVVRARKPKTESKLPH